VRSSYHARRAADAATELEPASALS
jgi:hypothetical protein